MEDLNKQNKSEVLVETYLCLFGQEVLDLCDREEKDECTSPDEAYGKIRQLWLQLIECQPEIMNKFLQIEQN
jgi:hypothetical protein